MKVIDEFSNKQVSTIAKTGQEMTVMVTPEILKELSSGIYSYQEAAIVREIISNAYDSMVRAGREDTPITITIPNHLHPYLEIKDTGTGLSVDDIYGKIFTLASSDKRDSNKYIGAKGIGAATPFAYTDSVTIVSVYEGVKTIFIAARNEVGIPRCDPQATFETDEPNGITFKIPVREEHFEIFAAEVLAYTSFFDTRPNITNIDFEYKFNDTVLEKFRDDGYLSPDNTSPETIHKLEETVKGSAVLSNHQRWVVMGGVTYPMSNELFNFIDNTLKKKSHEISNELYQHVRSKILTYLCTKNGVTPIDYESSNVVRDFINYVTERSVKDKDRSVAFSFTYNNTARTPTFLYLEIGDIAVAGSREAIKFDHTDQVQTDAIKVRIDAIIERHNDKKDVAIAYFDEYFDVWVTEIENLFKGTGEQLTSVIKNTKYEDAFNLIHDIYGVVTDAINIDSGALVANGINRHMDVESGFKKDIIFRVINSVCGHQLFNLYKDFQVSEADDLLRILESNSQYQKFFAFIERISVRVLRRLFSGTSAVWVEPTWETASITRTNLRAVISSLRTGNIGAFSDKAKYCNTDSYAYLIEGRTPYRVSTTIRQCFTRTTVFLFDPSGKQQVGKVTASNLIESGSFPTVTRDQNVLFVPKWEWTKFERIMSRAGVKFDVYDLNEMISKRRDELRLKAKEVRAAKPKVVKTTEVYTVAKLEMFKEVSDLTTYDEKLPDELITHPNLTVVNLGYIDEKYIDYGRFAGLNGCHPICGLGLGRDRQNKRVIDFLSEHKCMLFVRGKISRIAKKRCVRFLDEEATKSLMKVYNNSIMSVVNKAIEHHGLHEFVVKNRLELFGYELQTHYRVWDTYGGQYPFRLTSPSSVAPSCLVIDDPDYVGQRSPVFGLYGGHQLFTDRNVELFNILVSDIYTRLASSHKYTGTQRLADYIRYYVIRNLLTKYAFSYNKSRDIRFESFMVENVKEHLTQVPEMFRLACSADERTMFDEYRDMFHKIDYIDNCTNILEKQLGSRLETPLSKLDEDTTELSRNDLLKLEVQGLTEFKKAVTMFEQAQKQLKQAKLKLINKE